MLFYIDVSTAHYTNKEVDSMYLKINIINSYRKDSRIIYLESVKYKPHFRNHYDIMFFDSSRLLIFQLLLDKYQYQLDWRKAKKRAKEIYKNIKSNIDRDDVNLCLNINTDDNTITLSLYYKHYKVNHILYSTIMEENVQIKNY
jgi:hypothetical protein